MSLIDNTDAKTFKLELQQQRTASLGGRTSVFVALSIIGFMQVVSSVVVLLHLTGHIPQAHLSRELQRPTEVILNGSVPNGAVRERMRTGAKSRRHKSVMPAVHLPVQPAHRHTQRDVPATIIHWNPEQGNLHHFGYHNGRILVKEPGMYYVYAKTCFRYYDITEMGSDTKLDTHTLSPSDHGVQLIQYVFHERGSSRPVLLMKSGNTWRWKRGTYHMCCQQQSGVFSLQTGEGIYVSVLNVWLLDPEAEGSYFGAFIVNREM